MHGFARLQQLSHACAYFPRFRLHFMPRTVSATFAIHACMCACMRARACNAGGNVNTNAGAGAILAGGHHDNLKLNLFKRLALAVIK